jgi:hypothetical protein
MSQGDSKHVVILYKQRYCCYYTYCCVEWSNYYNIVKNKMHESSTLEAHVYIWQLLNTHEEMVLSIHNWPGASWSKWDQ